jgi:hypothetical protein
MRGQWFAPAISCPLFLDTCRSRLATSGALACQLVPAQGPVQEVAEADAGLGEALGDEREMVG